MERLYQDSFKKLSREMEGVLKGLSAYSVAKESYSIDILDIICYNTCWFQNEGVVFTTLELRNHRSLTI